MVAYSVALALRPSGLQYLPGQSVWPLHVPVAPANGWQMPYGKKTSLPFLVSPSVSKGLTRRSHFMVLMQPLSDLQRLPHVPFSQSSWAAQLGALWSSSCS